MTASTSASWLQALRIYTHPRVLGMLSLGFSAGLPLLLIMGTLSFWLREAGVDRTTIGYVSWVALAYAFKWVWAPLVEETMFRGALHGHLRRTAPILVSALISGFVFAAIHPQGLGGIPALTAMGINFALLREWRGSLIAPITAHAINNFFAVGIMLLVMG